MSKGVYRIEVVKVVYAICDDVDDADSNGGSYARHDGGEWLVDSVRLETGRALTAEELDSPIHGADGKTTVREALAEYEGR